MPEYLLNKLLINGIYGWILEIMRSFLALRRNVDRGLLFEESRRQGNQVRALVSSLGAPLRLTAPSVRRRDPRSSAVFVDERSYVSDHPHFWNL